MGSENVFNLVQIGPQAGTFYAPGSAAAAILKYPVESPAAFELDRASQFAKQDVGRNVRNRSGSGFHGVRGATATIESQVRFEDVMHLLEMGYAGDVSPSGAGPYTWLYPFEVGVPSVVPHTVEGANIDDAAASPMRLLSALASQITLSFDAITAPGASPWMISAELLAVDREIAAITAALEPIAGLEIAQGHLTRFYEGTVGTAFASLAELTGSLKSFSLTAQRNLTLRAYGGSTDKAASFGFTDQSNATIESMVAVSATAKTDFHDIWNVASPASLGERRWRLACAGSGTKAFTIDARVGITAVPIGESDGERLFQVNGELVDDSALDASHAITVVNGIADLTP